MTINMLELSLEYFNPFSNASVTNGRRSSNCGRVVAQFPFVSMFSAETTGQIFTKILHCIVALVALLNHVKALVHSVSECWSNECRW